MIIATRSMLIISRLATIVVVGLLTSCGGGSSGSSTPAAPVTPTAPGNGLVTFANGIKFNTNVDPTSSGFQYDAEPGSSQWNFPVQPNYTLTGYGAEVGLTIAFTFSRPTSSIIIASYIEPGTMTMTFTNGQVENRYLANDTLGGLYLLGKLSTPSEPDDFLITNTSQSPQAFLGPSTLNGATWTGGFEGSDAMSILSTTATAPSGELNCIEIQQNSSGTITDWWYLPGTGFVDTQRTTNGYSRGFHDANDPHFGGLSRSPFATN